MDTLPRELLLEIFTIGCESQFDNYRAPVSIHLVKWRKRSLKHFALHVSQVCALWRHLVHNVPSFWVTTLVFNLQTRKPISGHILRMQKLLDGSRESEIDVWFRPPQHTHSMSFEDVERCLCTSTLAPHQHRMRAIFAESLSLVYGSLLTGQLARGRWPALRVLALRSGESDCVLPSQPILAPGLRYLEVDEIAWKDNITPFQTCPTLNFIRGQRAASPSANAATWPLLTSHVRHLAQHLRRVKINIISDNHILSDKKHGRIELPQLSELWMSTTLSDQVIEWLNMFQTRKLKDLRICTFVGASADCEEFSNHALFRHVKKLTLAMPMESFPLLLNGDFVGEVEDLDCCLGSYRDTTPKLMSVHPVIKFPSLQNLLLDASATPSSNRISPNFFKSFDFSSVQNYIRFSAGEVQKLAFPYAKKLRIDNLGNMKSLSLPALRHLVIPLIETQQSKKFSEIESELLKFGTPFGKLHNLELSDCGFNLGYGKGILSIAPNVANLAVSGLPSIIARKVFRFPIDWRGVDVHKRPPKLSVVFPPRQQGDFATYFHAAHLIADSVKQVVKEQKDLGGPLRSLSFSNVPSFLNLEEMFSGEVDELEIIRANEVNDTRVFSM